MKTLFTFLFLLISQFACTRVAQRIAHGNSVSVSVSSRPSQTTGEVAKTNKTTDQEEPNNISTEDQIELESARFDLPILRKRVQEADFAAQADQKSYQAAIDQKDREMGRLKAELANIKQTPNKDAITLKEVIQSHDIVNKQARMLAFSQEHKIDSLNRVVAALQERYVRYEAGVNKLMESPAFHRNTVVVGDNSYSTTSYREPTRTRAPIVRRSSRQYITGPRGGCFYYTASGRKEYVDRSLCN